jgi:SAM-dependent methyltransferase
MIDARIAKAMFPNIPTANFYSFLKKQLHSCETILDLGCGSNSPIRFVSAKKHGVDISKSVIEIAAKKRTHDRFSVLDVNKINTKFVSCSFDAVVAIDLIEHVTKEDGARLLKKMENIARKKVIIFTPNGYLSQEAKVRHDRHLSGWTASQMGKMGYKVYGMYGSKFLRKEKHEIRFFPKFFWAIISEIIQWVYVIYFPEKAAAILCIKEKYD